METKKVLHVVNNFFGTYLYSELFSALAKKKVDQTVIVFSRKGQETKFENRSELPGIKIININIKSVYRFHSKLQAKKVIRVLEMNKSINFKSFDKVIAHTLCANGSVAFELFKKYHIPFVVAIRNSDINFAYKYFYYLRKYYNRIVKNAEKIVCLSPASEARVKDSFIGLSRLIVNKTYIIPNGINKVFFDNTPLPKSKIANDKTFKFIFIGDITFNKQIFKLIHYVSKLKSEGVKTHLDIVGRKRRGMKNYIYYQLFLKHIKDRLFIEYHGFLNDKEKILQKLNENHCFIMLSRYETFGLVYIEALSQGLPVIYSKGQGIDGFESLKSVAYGIKSYEEFKKAFIEIRKQFNLKSEEAIKVANEFSWTRISEIYSNVLL